MLAGLISTYPEGAFRRIASGLEDSGSLSQVILPSRGLTRGAARVLGNKGAVGRAASSSAEIPRTIEIRPDLEIRRAFAKIVKSHDSHLRLAKAMARAASKHLDRSVDTVISLPMCGLESFVDRPDCFRVIHQVNTPAPIHNSRLLDYYEYSEVRAELHGAEYIDRFYQELAECDAVLTPAARVSVQLREVGLTGQSVVELPYGVDLERFDGEVNTRANGASTPQVIYAGQLSLRKGIPFLLQAASASRVPLTLVGPVVDERLLANLPMNVTYKGVLSHQELAREFSDHDAFIYPTIEDNFALGVLEAAASGLPVFCTPTAGAAEVLNSLSSFVQVAVGEAASLADAMSGTEILTASQRADNAAQFRTLARRSSLRTWDSYATEVTRMLTVAAGTF